MLRRLRFFFACHRVTWVLCLALCGLLVWASTVELRLDKMASYDRIGPDVGQWDIYRPHPTLFWQLRPNLRVSMPFSDYACGDSSSDGDKNFRVSTNSWGMRNPETAQAKGPRQWRILCLGDELAFGYGVDDNQTYASQLQRMLRNARHQKTLQVLNGGCPGWSCYQLKEWTRLVGRSLQPDYYIVGFSTADFAPEDKNDSERVSSFAPWRLLQLCLYDYNLYMYYHRRQAQIYNPYGLPPVDYQRNKLRVPKEEYNSNLLWFTTLAARDGARVIFLDVPVQDKNISALDSEYREVMRDVAQQSGSLYVDVGQYLVTHSIGMSYISKRYPTAQGYIQIADIICEGMRKRGWVQL